MRAVDDSTSATGRSALQCVAVCCSMLQCAAVCWRVLECVRVLECDAVCCISITATGKSVL